LHGPILFYDINAELICWPKWHSKP